MNQILRLTFILFSFLLSFASKAQEESLAGGCEVTFSLMGYDTLCSTQAPFNVAPGLPFGGTYSGPGMEADFFNPALTGPGQFEITYTYDDGVCIGSATAIMTVIPSPGLQFIGLTEVCYGDTVILSSPDGQEYTWENGVKNDSITFYPVESFTSYATGIDEAGCQSLTYFDISVILPPAMVITGPDGICIGESGQYTVTGADSWIWYNGSTDPTIEISPNSSLIVSVTSTLGACDTTVAIDVLVQPFPDVFFEVPQFICFGDSLVLAPTGAELYRGPLGFFETTQTLFPTASTSIIIDGFNDAGCTGQFVFDIEVRDLPEFTFSVDDSICFGNLSHAEVIGGANYIWTDLDLDMEVQSGAVNILDISPMVSTNYQVEVFGANECSVKENYFVEVLPLPELSIDQLQPACIGKITSFLASGATSYEWNNLTNDNPYFFTVTDSVDLQLIGTDDFGCSNTISYFVEAHETPVVSVSGTPIICEGESSLLTASGADTYTWPDGSSETQFLVFPQQDSIVMLVGTTVFGCTDFTNYQITVKPAPELIITGQDTICAGGFLELSVVSEFDFNWTDGTMTNPLTVQLTSDSILTATSLGANGCTNEVGFYCHVRPFPMINIEGDTELCSGESTTLVASGPAYVQWVNFTEGNSITVTPLTSTVYYIEGLDDFGCEVMNPVPVTVYQMPVIYFAFNNDTICDYNESLIWQANPPGGVYSGDGVVDGHFYPSEAIHGLNMVTYSYTNAQGCVAHSTDEIFVEDCVGLEESQETMFVLYPNPADDHFTINASFGSWTAILIYDARGGLIHRVARNTSANVMEIQTGTWSSGFYEVVVIDGSGHYHKKSLIIR